MNTDVAHGCPPQCAGVLSSARETRRLKELARYESIRSIDLWNGQQVVEPAGAICLKMPAA
jgi:hypothetical protein